MKKNFFLSRYFAKFAVLCVLLASCRSIPEGHPPEGPIAPPLETNNLPTEKSAINIMITALATTCPALTGAGMEKPFFSNEFSLSDPRINHMPMELWRNLLKMKLVSECQPNSPEEQYRLVSEFEKKENEDEFSWRVTLQKMPNYENVWQKTIVFKISR